MAKPAWAWRRTTFLIDEKGVVEKVFQKVKAAENAREILDYLEG